MDPEKEEKIKRERERIRIASQKSRQKKREEEQSLRHENEQMKRERLALLSTLEELRETLARLQNQLEDKSEARSENEKLSRELQNYKEFGVACVLMGKDFNLEKGEISESAVRSRLLEQMTKSGGDMANLQAERILTDALGSSGSWVQLGFNTHVKQISSCVRSRYRINEDGSGEWQFHLCLPISNHDAKYFADKYKALWIDPRPMISIFGLSYGWSQDIIGSKVEELIPLGPTRLQRIRIKSSAKSWFFVLTEQNAVPIARSILAPSSVELVPTVALEDHTLTSNAGNSGDACKRGVVDCYMGARASMMLDSSSGVRDDCVKGKFFEAFRVWDDELVSGTPNSTPKKCVRAVLALSVSADFSRETFGEYGYSVVIDTDTNTVSPAYQKFINFLACFVGIDKLKISDTSG